MKSEFEAYYAAEEKHILDMVKNYLRPIRIFFLQFHHLSFSRFILLFIKALFKSERILIYLKEFDEEMNSNNSGDFSNVITKGELGELRSIRDNTEAPLWEFCCDVYDQVNDFFIAKNNNTISHISWIYYNKNPNRLIRLDSDEAEIKYCLTLSSYRGRGLYPAALTKMQGYLQKNGYKRVFICVKEGNIPSIKGIEKANFKFIAKFHLLKVMGIQINKKYHYIK